MHLPMTGSNRATRLLCGQCDDVNSSHLIADPADDTATCQTCGDVKCISLDIDRHVDPDERLVLTHDGFLAVISVN